MLLSEAIADYFITFTFPKQINYLYESANLIKAYNTEANDV
jgi:hypothetical protein